MRAKKVFKMGPDHDKFCLHYSEYGNATQAYLFAWKHVTYETAKTEGSKLLSNPHIANKIQQLKEEFAVQYNQTKEGTIRDLIQAAEEAKNMAQFSAYAKLREMIIRLCGLNPADKTENKQDITIRTEQPLFGPDKTDEQL